FIMLQLSPRSTLFPYTTLFRSRLDRGDLGVRPLQALGGRLVDVQTALLARGRLDDLRASGDRGGGKGDERAGGRARDNGAFRHRSEEHTSELQSRGHLVCRLLL